MSSVKKNFFRGLCYDYTAIVNLRSEINETIEALNYVAQGRNMHYYKKLQDSLHNLKHELYFAEKRMKEDIKYFSYTDEDLQGEFKPVYLTEEQIQADYERDIKESEKEKVNYSFQKILEKAHELDKIKENKKQIQAI